jgi:YjbE family integral membrane protein
MEILSTEFLSALLAIVVIDLVLAGDNAIVIALAARNLPAELRKKAIVWGTFGAIAVRTAMTLVVVWLLKIPGLLLMGGALLVWIAYKLLADNDGPEHQVSAATNFWGAMKTIVVADAVMGLDNVLAVAGAAHGSFLLVVLGLLISIPIVIWGSQLILKYVERFPAIVYIGGAVLAWTAAKMIVSEPVVKDYLANQALLTGLVYAVVITGVLGTGFWVNHARARARVAGHLVDLAIVPGAESGAGNLGNQGGATMMKILLPVDGSANALQAVRHVVNRFLGDSAMEVHLLHVRAPLSQHIARFVSRRDRENFHKDEAERALAPARDLLNQFGVPHAEHIELGEKAATIHRVAQRLRVNQIVMGTARKNAITRVL